ncbi:junctional adhesion molecule-like isoform X2 [Monodelphis domestica]|uniref:Junction adhesion molecule like n=1 Tax=Monodelphis domestica TaxID=13616 RepID=A0A5F8H9S7_MONDO|nr:junctional adhesion molecule-like isoform X2 [Monodelphis domestica]
MFSPLELKLLPVLLGCILGLGDLVVSSSEVIAHVGDSILLRCVFQSTMMKQVTKVDWRFSAREHAQEELVLYYYANLSVPLGQFTDRVHFVGKISDNDGSICLQDVREADQGVYTCEIQIYQESFVFKKKTILQVVPAKPTTLKPTEAFRTDVLSSYQHVIIVGIVCFTIILLAALGVSMRRSQRHHRSGNHPENTIKAKPGVEAHVYSTVTTVIEEEESSRESEATYMSMQSVWPSQRAERNKSSEIMPETEQSFGGPKFIPRPLTKEDNIFQ